MQGVGGGLVVVCVWRFHYLLTLFVRVVELGVWVGGVPGGGGGTALLPTSTRCRYHQGSERGSLAMLPAVAPAARLHPECSG
jgi:hypothetical protein